MRRELKVCDDEEFFFFWRKNSTYFSRSLPCQRRRRKWWCCAKCVRWERERDCDFTADIGNPRTTSIEFLRRKKNGFFLKVNTCFGQAEGRRNETNFYFRYSYCCRSCVAPIIILPLKTIIFPPRLDEIKKTTDNVASFGRSTSGGLRLILGARQL